MLKGLSILFGQRRQKLASGWDKVVIDWINRSQIKSSAAKYFCIFGLIDLKIKSNKKDHEGKYNKEETRGP